MSFQNNKEAFVLANTYGFCPPQAAYPSRIRRTDSGKYELHYNTATGTHQLVLAHWLGKTNILILYNPALNFYVPYHVTGTLDPDASGNYTPESGYMLKFTYVGPERAFFIWWDGVDSWIISASVGWKEGPYWSLTSPSKCGHYDPYGGAVGTAAVATGPE